MEDNVKVCEVCNGPFMRRGRGWDKYRLTASLRRIDVSVLQALKQVYKDEVQVANEDGHICASCYVKLERDCKTHVVQSRLYVSAKHQLQPTPLSSPIVKRCEVLDSPLARSTPKYVCLKRKRIHGTVQKRKGLDADMLKSRYTTAFKKLLSTGAAAQRAFNVLVEQRVRREVAVFLEKICKTKPSIISADDVEKFAWCDFMDELKDSLPVLWSSIKGAMPRCWIKRDEPDRCNYYPRIGMMMSIPLYSHRPQTFKFIQLMNGVQMFRSGANDKLFKCFNYLGICQSRIATRKHIDALVIESDTALKQWQKVIENSQNTQGTNSMRDSYTNETLDDPDYEQVDETLTSDQTANAAVARADMTENHCTHGECDRVSHDRDTGIDAVDVATRDDTGNVLFGCNECGATFSDPDDLSNHATTAGCDRNDDTNRDDVTDTKTPPYIVESDSESVSARSADFQMPKSPKSVNLCCPQCDAGFALKRDLNEHIRLMHAVFQSSICNEHFKTRRELGSHVSHHTDDGSLICMVCNKQFETSETLKEHEQGCMQNWHFDRNRRMPSKRLECKRQLSHSRSIADAYHSRCQKECICTQPVTCGLCTKQFTLMNKLHMHTARKHIASPMCVICYRDLDTWHELKEHLLAHTGESNVLKEQNELVEDDSSTWQPLGVVSQSDDLREENELVEDDSSSWQPLGVVSQSDDWLAACETHNEIIDLDHNYSFPASSENADVLESRDESSVDDVLNKKVLTTRAKKRRKFIR